MNNYIAKDTRYDKMRYNRCGNSGLKLPTISLGLWHNWGDVDVFENSKNMLLRAFDMGITHFDLANNYGPPPGTAERNFGRILKENLKSYRDELIISTKAGWDMWPGPYGDYGSRKYLIASLDQSLKRMGLEYVDIFYHHRPDPETPLYETMAALDHIVRSGKALYIGISQYNHEQTGQAIKILKKLGTPLLIHQPKYSMFNRWVEPQLLDVLEEERVGVIPFSPLAQGLLSNKYLSGIPENSRAAKESGYLKRDDVSADKIAKITALNEIAQQRNQSLAQMAVAWVLRKKVVTSALIGASRVEQIEELVLVLDNITFDEGEIENIDNILNGNK